jgi:hypothetical protein
VGLFEDPNFQPFAASPFRDFTPRSYKRRSHRHRLNENGAADCQGGLSDQKQQSLRRRTKEKRKPLAPRGARPDPRSPAPPVWVLIYRQRQPSPGHRKPHSGEISADPSIPRAWTLRRWSRPVVPPAGRHSGARIRAGAGGGRAWLTWDKGHGLFVFFISGAGFRPTLLSCWDRTEKQRRSVLCALAQKSHRPGLDPAAVQAIDALRREPAHCSPDVTSGEKVTGRMFARD